MSSASRAPASGAAVGALAASRAAFVTADKVAKTASNADAGESFPDTGSPTALGPAGGGAAVMATAVIGVSQG